MLKRRKTGVCKKKGRWGCGGSAPTERKEDGGVGAAPPQKARKLGKKNGGVGAAPPQKERRTGVWGQRPHMKIDKSVVLTLIISHSSTISIKQHL